MRICLLVLPLAAMTGPALGQAKPAPVAPAETIVVPQALSDPATAEKLSRMMQSLSNAFLNLPVGEIEAAAQGRPVTSADRTRTMREVGRRDDPNFEQNMQRDLAATRPMMQATMKAFVAALPAMMKGMSEAGRELEKAADNMPRPNYPKR